MSSETETHDKDDAVPANWSVRRLNTLIDALGYENYLEVGVFRGETFKGVKCASKVAVDPAFKYDFEASAGPGEVYHQVTSDDYFKTLEVGQTFDVVFLDGLHTFEQTYRDFCNTLIHCHANSVILIDDTRPNDPFSAHPDMVTALTRRSQLGIPGQSWHGDVYKIVWAIRDFHPGIRFRTITGGGNMQTLCWFSKAEPKPPAFNHLEAISRMSYFDILNRLDEYSPSKEAEALELCISEIRARQ